ncbi:MAG: DNA polymerase III subunit delta', partial [Rothia dentocariosa]
HDPAALQRRETLPLLIMNIRSISSAYAAADRLITLAEQDAAEAAAARDEKERAELLAILGITEGARISPSLRSQVRRLEDEQKRRAKRIQSDTLLRSMTEIQTVLRDVLTLQLNSGSALMNEHAGDALAEFAARTSAVQTLEHVQALEVVLGRLRTNANARLLIEGFMGRFVH